MTDALSNLKGANYRGVTGCHQDAPAETDEEPGAAGSGRQRCSHACRWVGGISALPGRAADRARRGEGHTPGVFGTGLLFPREITARGSACEEVSCSPLGRGWQGGGCPSGGPCRPHGAEQRGAGEPPAAG